MLRQITTVVCAATFVLIIGTVPAHASGWGSTDCTQYPHPGCELHAGQGGNDKQGGNSGNGRPERPEGDSGRHSPTDGPFNSGGDTIIGDDPNLARCQYERSGYQGPPPGDGVQTAAFVIPSHRGAAPAEAAAYRPQTEPAVAQPTLTKPRLVEPASPGGAWYDYKCTTAGSHDALYRPPVWIADPQPGPAPGPPLAQLAVQARNQLRLPIPRIQANPAADQLVGLPTWMWLDRASWGAVSATAAVPGVSVTARATPTSVTWAMGDGSAVTCTGPGSPFPVGGDPTADSPDCGYTYRTSSAGQPSRAFPVTATVAWTVTWAGAGQRGTFPTMTTAITTSFRVSESQAITTG